MKRRKQQHELLMNLLLLGIMLLVMFIVLEITVRFAWESPRYNYPSGLHMPDETKGYVYVPNFSGNFPGKQFKDIPIIINSKGLRDYEHTYNKSSLRILGLGDSVTFGAGVHREDTYLSVLERMYDDVEIVKGGVNGYEFDQQLTYYKEELWKYDADMVLYSVVLNDPRPTDPRKVRQESFTKDFVARNFQLASFVYYTYKGLAAPTDYDDTYFNSIYGLWEGETLDAYLDEVRELEQMLRKEDKELVLVVFPYTQQFASTFARVPQDTLLKFGEEENITVIDLYPLLASGNWSQHYLARDNVHLSVEGNREVAAYIHDQLNI